MPRKTFNRFTPEWWTPERRKQESEAMKARWRSGKIMQSRGSTGKHLDMSTRTKHPNVSAAVRQQRSENMKELNRKMGGNRRYGPRSKYDASWWTPERRRQRAEQLAKRTDIRDLKTFWTPEKRAYVSYCRRMYGQRGMEMFWRKYGKT